MLATGLVIAFLALSWSGWLEAQADRRLGAVLERALITAALARGLNGVISMAHGTEIAVQPMGVGITFSAGQILDPLNDLVERFSWLALVASASLGTQMLLTDIAAEPAVSGIATVAAGIYLVLLWWPGLQGAAFLAMRVLAMVLLLRFLFTGVALTVSFVDAWVLESRQQAAMAELSLTREEIQSLQSQSPAADGGESSMLEQFNTFLHESSQLLDLGSRLDALQERVESAISDLLELIVLFLVQTLLVPIGAFWLGILAFRAAITRVRPR